MQASNSWRDLSQGTVTAGVSAVATNPLLHWQYCKIFKKKFLWLDIGRGFSPNLAGTFGYMSIAYMSKGFFDSTFENKSNLSKCLIGMGSGALSSLGACPGERVALADNKTGNGGLKLGYKIFKVDGIRGLYRGIAPTAARDSLSVGGMTTWGPMFNRSLTESGVNPLIATLGSGLIVGFGTVVATQPFQTLRMRMQEKPHVKFSVIWKRVRRQGVRTLYAGLVPRISVNVVLNVCGIGIDKYF